MSEDTDAGDYDSKYRLGLPEWLQEQVQSGTHKDVFWIEEEEHIFQIPWKHASMNCWEDRDASLFKAWAMYTNRYREGIDAPKHKQWKSNFRCAINSHNRVFFVKEHDGRRGANRRVIKIVNPGTAEKCEKRVPKRKLYTSSRSKSKDEISCDARVLNSLETLESCAKLLVSLKHYNRSSNNNNNNNNNNSNYNSNNNNNNNNNNSNYNSNNNNNNNNNNNSKSLPYGSGTDVAANGSKNDDVYVSSNDDNKIKSEFIDVIGGMNHIGDNKNSDVRTVNNPEHEKKSNLTWNAKSISPNFDVAVGNQKNEPSLPVHHEGDQVGRKGIANSIPTTVIVTINNNFVMDQEKNNDNNNDNNHNTNRNDMLKQCDDNDDDEDDDDDLIMPRDWH